MIFNILISLAQTILDKLNKLNYAWSYYRAGKDKEVMYIAEEGMQNYLEDLEANDHQD